ncbi:hypothetical protein BZA05DRAFT_472385 [Tricharina praecox]|uniref:uncharacterized protein n=1 Tax=Tricharina praecox TaxID=43433 RepID=UPI00221E54E7|nr:uncharacterized protein BZA05DRAFT_472385 [Tricharina praecox]KAI5855527.1 hypothetical protein BZA05DRAFT_472385 [Tricharina praecox]
MFPPTTIARVPKQSDGTPLLLGSIEIEPPQPKNHRLLGLSCREEGSIETEPPQLKTISKKAPSHPPSPPAHPPSTFTPTILNICCTNGPKRKLSFNQIVVRGRHASARQMPDVGWRSNSKVCFLEIVARAATTVLGEYSPGLFKVGVAINDYKGGEEPAQTVEPEDQKDQVQEALATHTLRHSEADVGPWPRPGIPLVVRLEQRLPAPSEKEAIGKRRTNLINILLKLVVYSFHGREKDFQPSGIMIPVKALSETVDPAEDLQEIARELSAKWEDFPAPTPNPEDEEEAVDEEAVVEQFTEPPAHGDEEEAVDEEFMGYATHEDEKEENDVETVDLGEGPAPTPEPEDEEKAGECTEPPAHGDGEEAVDEELMEYASHEDEKEENNPPSWMIRE